MLEFECVTVRSLNECLRALSRYGTEAALLGGGTDLYILMKTGMRAPKVVVHAGSIPELRDVTADDGEISIGAGVTHSQLAGFAALHDIDCLSAAAGAVGSPQIRNLGTAGGNVANASPAADLYPPLIVLDAVLDLECLGGGRQVAVEDFVTGPGMTVLRPDEVVSRIRLNKPEGKFFSGFAKVGLRNALAISVACAAMLATCRDGKFDHVRIACGAVAPRPIRMRETERLLVGAEPAEDLITQAAEVASRECEPITDIRATSRYRRHVAGVIVSRLIEDAARALMDHGGDRTGDA